MSDEHRDLAKGVEYPYHGRKPNDWAEAAALGILYDLNDRRSIKQGFYGLDDGVKVEIVEKMASIIRAASPMPSGD